MKFGRIQCESWRWRKRNWSQHRSEQDQFAVQCVFEVNEYELIWIIKFWLHLIKLSLTNSSWPRKLIAFRDLYFTRLKSKQYKKRYHKEANFMGCLLQNQKWMLWSRRTPQSSYCYGLREILVRVSDLEYTSKKNKEETCMLLNILFDKILTLHSFGSLSHMHPVIKVTPKYVTFSLFFFLFSHISCHGRNTL